MSSASCFIVRMPTGDWCRHLCLRSVIGINAHVIRTPPGGLTPVKQSRVAWRLDNTELLRDLYIRERERERAGHIVRFSTTCVVRRHSLTWNVRAEMTGLEQIDAGSIRRFVKEIGQNLKFGYNFFTAALLQSIEHFSWPTMWLRFNGDAEISFIDWHILSVVPLACRLPKGLSEKRWYREYSQISINKYVYG